MDVLRAKILFCISFSYAIIFLLNILPAFLQLKAVFFALLLNLSLYWSCVIAAQFTLVHAFIVGLIFDFISGSLWGVNALIFSVIIYAHDSLKKSMLEEKMWLQLLAIFNLFSIAQILAIGFLWLYTRHIYNIIPQLLTIVFGVLLWPVLKYMLDKYRTLLFALNE